MGCISQLHHAREVRGWGRGGGVGFGTEKDYKKSSELRQSHPLMVLKKVAIEMT
jgi:hypothetical protein